MKMLGCFTSVALVLWGAFTCETIKCVSQTCHSPEGAPSCTDSRNQIVEAPRGPVDGQNFAFTLSAIPTSGADVHVTVNGSDISQGSTLVVRDRSILFYPPAVPKAGDLIRALYQTQFVSAPGGENSFASLIEPLAGVALLRMVDKEDIPPRSAVSKVAQPGTTYASSTQASGQTGERALLMLAQRLSAADREQRLGSNGTAENELRSLTGVEGIGDVAPVNPYDALFEAGTASGAVARKGGADQSQGIVQFRSLKMLRQILEGEPSK